MQKFFTQTLVSGFIKNLLANTPLFLHETANTRTKMIAGAYYVYNGMLIQCTETGTLYDNTAKYSVVSRCVPGTDYLNLTTRYVSYSDSYDTDTHRFLGEYLRQYRDLYGVDMLMYYNCFTPKLAEDIDLSGGQTETYKTYLTHIHFNQIYTLAVDCTLPFYICPVIYTDVGVSLNNTMIGEPILKKATTFNKPFTYELPTTDLDLYNNRANLYLAISIPKDIKSSITVLEGDFTHSNSEHIFNSDVPTRLDPIVMNNILVYNPLLLWMNVEQYVPFSPRLIEFLSGNIITKQDDISQNIARVEQKLDGGTNKLFDIYGIWDDAIRYIIYLQNYSKGVYSSDLNSWVNKNIELLIDQGQYEYSVGRILYTGHYKIGYRYDWMNIEELTPPTYDQYDIDFPSESIGMINNILDVTDYGSRESRFLSTETYTAQSVRGQCDIIVPNYFVTNLNRVVVNGHELTRDLDYLLSYKNLNPQAEPRISEFKPTPNDLSSEVPIYNNIKLTGTYGGGEHRLWEPYVGGLAPSVTNNIQVDFSYYSGAPAVRILLYELEITYYE